MISEKTYKSNPPKIGEGIFLIRDICEILVLPYPRVRHWVIEFWDNRLGKAYGNKYSFGDNNNRAVNFYSLIEFYTFYHLRQKGVSAQRIQKAHKVISKEVDTLYPFAKAGISTDGKEIWYDHLENLIKADGSTQFDFKQIIEPFLLKIEYDKDLLAEKYYPLGKTHSVVVDPKHQFGQPTIQGTNIKIETLYRLFKGGETKDNLCVLYELKKSQVSDVILYYENRRA